MTDHQFAGALGEPNVRHVEGGHLADPQAGSQQHLHQRAVARRAQTISREFYRAEPPRR